MKVKHLKLHFVNLTLVFVTLESHQQDVNPIVSYHKHKYGFIQYVSANEKLKITLCSLCTITQTIYEKR